MLESRLCQAKYESITSGAPTASIAQQSFTGGITMISRRNENPTPVYFKLQSFLRDKIEQGDWKPGDRIPPERVFAEEHRLSIGTVKKAISNLVNEGFLYRIQGKGTFVTGTYIRRDKIRYYRSYSEFGDSENDLTIKLLDIRKIKPLPEVNKLLKLRANAGLFRIDRIMNSDDGPLILSVSYLPQRKFADLDTPLFRQKIEKIALYSILEESYGVPTIYNQELIGADRADAEVARHLKVRRGSPLLVIEMLSFTYRDNPYEYRISHCLTEQKKLFREY